MGRKISRKWMERMTTALNAEEPIDETFSFAPAAKWLIVKLATRDVPYRVINLGAGVKRITTTDAKVCAACKGKGFSDA